MRALVIALALLFAASAFGQLKERPEDAAPPSAPIEGLVDEDEDVLPQTNYVFNPLQAKKDLKIGDFYTKKGSHRAAAARYLEATRWNPQFSDAFWKLAESRERLKQPSQALEAYRNFLRVGASGKRAETARKRVAELESEIEQLPLAASDESEEKKAQREPSLLVPRRTAREDSP